MASKGVELGGYNTCFDVNDKTINTLVDFTEEELNAFTLESMKMQSSLDEVKMLDQLHYQTFLTTTSSTNMSQAPVSSTTTMSSTSNIEQVPNSTPVLRQILNEPMSRMSQLPDQPIPMQQYSTTQMMPQLQDQGAFTMLPMPQTMSQLTAMIPMQTSTQMSTMLEPQQATSFQGIGLSTTMPPLPPLRTGASMAYATTNEMSDMPPLPPPLKQEYPIRSYEWNYMNSHQPQQPMITPYTFETNRMRTLPSANSFNKPPVGFKSKIKTFVSLLRTMVPSVDEKILALLNIIDQNHYGSTMPDKGEIIFVTFNENLDVWFKRKYLEYAVEGKVFDTFIKIWKY